MNVVTNERAVEPEPTPLCKVGTIMSVQENKLQGMSENNSSQGSHALHAVVVFGQLLGYRTIQQIQESGSRRGVTRPVDESWSIGIKIVGEVDDGISNFS